MKINDHSKGHNVKGITLTYADGSSKHYGTYPPTPEEALEIVQALAEKKLHNFVIRKGYLQ